MNIEHIFMSFLVIGVISAVTLVVIPEIKNLTKIILIFLVSFIWIYTSINFLAANCIYIFHDSTGIFILISATGGVLASILASAVIVAFLNEKRT